MANTSNNSRQIVKVSGKLTKVGDLDTWRGLTATFVASCQVKQSSRLLYVRTLIQFFKWVEDSKKNLPTLTSTDILEYRDSLEASGRSNLTIGSYLVTVREFYAWAEGRGLYRNIAKGIKTPRRKKDEFVKQHLSDEQAAALLDFYKDRSLRDYAIVNLMLRTGLRTIEVVRADIEDITYRGGNRILKIWGKGNEAKDDYVMLTDKAYIPIHNYLITRKGAKGGEPLFCSESHQNSGKRLTTRTISQICKDGLRGIGLDCREFSAHSLRHTTACSMLMHGASLMQVQYSLRHNSPLTTEIYLKSLKKENILSNSYQLLDSAF